MKIDNPLLTDLTAKNPPIDADKVIYQNSASADATVTSTWAQVKTFLGATFAALAHALDGASHTVAGRTAGQILRATAATTFGWSTATYPDTAAKGGLVVATDANVVGALAVGATTEILVGGGAATVPVWTTATGSGAPVRETSPTIVTPTIAATGWTNANHAHTAANSGGVIQNLNTITAPATNVLTITNQHAATLDIHVEAGKTLSLISADNFNLTIPATGVAALLGTANVFTAIQTIQGLLDLNHASGGQIKFPATQNASADVNTLDDYEEGAYTPTVTSAVGTITSYTANAIYVKVGRLVVVTQTITITNVGSGAGALFSTLPFAVATLAAIGCGRENAATGKQLQVIANVSTTQVSILTYDNNSTIGTNYVIIFNVAYFT